MIRWDEAELRRISRDVAVPVAEDILDLAKQRVPVRTGELRDSLSVVVEEEGAYVVAAAEHARWVHDGTSDTRAVPFLMDAAGSVRIA